MPTKLQDHVGLDFGNHSVKAVYLSSIHSTPKLEAIGSQPTPVSITSSTEKINKQRLADAVKKLYDEAKIRNDKVVMAIPESIVLTRFTEYVGIKDNELKSVVYHEAKRYFSIPIDQMRITMMKIGFDETRNAQKVIILACPTEIVHIYEDVALMAGLEPLAIETEALAISRSIYSATKSKEMIILDFGAKTTDMAILNDGNLVFSQSINIGSDVLTQSVINKYNFDESQAEEYKRTYGVQKDVLENKIYDTLSPVLDSMIIEIQRAFEFYKSRTLMYVPQICYINGDGALLPGLTDYLKEKLSLEVSMPDIFSSIKIDEEKLTNIKQNRSAYSLATGLSLRLYNEM